MRWRHKHKSRRGGRRCGPRTGREVGHSARGLVRAAASAVSGRGADPDRVREILERARRDVDALTGTQPEAARE